MSDWFKVKDLIEHHRNALIWKKQQTNDDKKYHTSGRESNELFVLENRSIDYEKRAKNVKVPADLGRIPFKIAISKGFSSFMADQ
ncbi:2160_t:CDS:2 [Funneliformis caledonium]|uniref:2160_t:CDS:1 n=1 Tax=Funneliformis caledonium TaxID=1117310 RepID=A0A9N9EV22_9GLOM|nr:2160_t:CDS:2 [Funneliformis caledonium]